MFTEQDLEQIKTHGLTKEKVNAQITRIKSGMVFSNLVEAATIGNGIIRFSPQEQQKFIADYDKKRNHLSIVKFVPASGAATRMFKFLFQFLKEFESGDERIGTYERKHKTFWVFLSGLEKFPFYAAVIKRIKAENPLYDNLSYGQKCLAFVHTMLGDKQLNYGFYPKGLLPFHSYKDGVVTAFREHLLESVVYASSNKKAHLHFTVSEAHYDMFNTELEHVRPKLEAETQTEFLVDFSFQKKATDTVAITAEDTLFRTSEGKLLFRPSGHGALLENLNALNHDIIFVKNIDNIVVYHKNKVVSEYRKLLAGVLLDIQEQVFSYLRMLDEGEVSEEKILEIATFASKSLHVILDVDFDDFPKNKKTSYLHDRLNRPIRVCGMVKNEGEPGGGPFWVKNQNGTISLQIVEFAQIDIHVKQQREIVKNASHFNPTDLVCGVKNYKGEKFNLLDYVDHNAAFITMKSQDGTDIKALELPGLWNGSMAYWNSIFVEIPLETFNPVKTVNDLLKPAHQNEA
ncbi:MAG: DUF4301 family protein [Flavobacteriaceae bacterium]